MRRRRLLINVALFLGLINVGSLSELCANDRQSVQYRSFASYRSSFEGTPNVSEQIENQTDPAGDADPANNASADSLPVKDEYIASETTSEEITRLEYQPPWERLKWAFNGAGFVTAPVDRNPNYEHRADACLAGELALCFPMTERDCFGVYFKMGDGDWLDYSTPTFSEFVDQDYCFSEAWYEHTFEGGLRYRVGRIDLTLNGFDANEFASSGFDHFSSTGLINNLAWSSPGASFGALAWKDFGERWSIGAAYQCANESRDIFSYGYSMGQVEYHSDFGGRKGNYRFYTWIQNDPYLEEINLGWGCSCDQELTKKLGVWTRVGFQDEDCATVGAQFSGGIALNHIGCRWNWNDAAVDDSFGVGVSVAKASRLMQEEFAREAGTETFLETYYRCGLNEYGHISPYMQYVCRPLGERDAGSIYVLGVRAGFNL